MTPESPHFLIANLLADVDAFCAAHGWSGWKFGAEAIGDKHLIERLRNGGDLKVSTERRVRQFMASYREAA